MTKRIRGRRWMFIRKMVLDDEPLCRVCQEPATEVDHIIALHRGGTDERENLQPLCQECHADKTAEDKQERRKASIDVNGYPIKGWLAK